MIRWVIAFEAGLGGGVNGVHHTVVPFLRIPQGQDNFGIRIGRAQFLPEIATGPVDRCRIAGKKRWPVDGLTKVSGLPERLMIRMIS